MVWIVIQIFLWGYAITVVLPMIWTVLQSFRNSKEIIFEPWNFPSSLLWENYSNALISLNVATYFLNSVIVTTTSLALGVLLASMIAYVLARYDFFGNRFIYYYLLSSMVIPGFLLAVPLWLMIREWGMLNNYASLILIYSSGLAWSVFILHALLQDSATRTGGCRHHRRLLLVRRLVAGDDAHVHAWVADGVAVLLPRPLERILLGLNHPLG